MRWHYRSLTILGRLYLKVGSSESNVSTIVHRKLNQALAVLENMSIFKQCLTNHHDVAAQLFRDQRHATPQEEVLELGGARSNASCEATSDARVSREKGLSDGDRPPPYLDIHHPSSDPITLPITEALHEKGEAEDTVSGNSMQHENSQAMSTASQGSRLHLPDFIQNLSA